MPISDVRCDTAYATTGLFGQRRLETGSDADSAVPEADVTCGQFSEAAVVSESAGE
jgi:hypothetical protein